LGLFLSIDSAKNEDSRSLKMWLSIFDMSVKIVINDLGWFECPENSCVPLEIVDIDFLHSSYRVVASKANHPVGFLVLLWLLYSHPHAET